MKKTEVEEAIEVLKKIAMMGHGIKDEMRDWANIGRNAVHTAKEAVAGKCPTCNRPKVFDPEG